MIFNYYQHIYSHITYFLTYLCIFSDNSSLVTQVPIFRWDESPLSYPPKAIRAIGARYVVVYIG